jgi:hypothetical protein
MERFLRDMQRVLGKFMQPVKEHSSRINAVFCTVAVDFFELGTLSFDIQSNL